MKAKMAFLFEKVDYLAILLPDIDKLTAGEYNSCEHKTDTGKEEKS
jgi:hypothetical protein